MTIKKAVFPVAGLGTRFLPASKAIPKEMLPVVDKPLIQYATEEAVEAGITELIFITGYGKDSIADHFDRHHELERVLEQKGRDDMLASIREILPSTVTCSFIRQPEALGLGHAVLCARAAVGQEPFAVILPDDLIDARPHGALQQLVDVYDSQRSSVIAVENVPADQTDRYGIVEIEATGTGTGRLTSIVEKPTPETAPSTLAVVGRYILSPRVFDMLISTQQGIGGEIQLTDAIAALLQEEPVYTCEFEGVRYDCGNKLGFLQATVNFGLKHPETGTAFSGYLQSLPGTKN